MKVMQSFSARRTLQHAVVYALLIAASALYLLPLVYMVSVSLKPSALDASLFPEKPTLAPYREVLGLAAHPKPSSDGGNEHRSAGPAVARDADGFNFALYARNTLIVLVLSLFGMVLSSAIAAYGFARITFPGRNVMFAACLATMMIPFPVIMVPTYMLFAKLGWIGSFKPLWVPAWFGSAFNVFLLRQFFLGIPRDLEEAAMIDGCTRWGCFWRIMLPLSKPAIAVVALFHCLAVWNDLVGPLIYLSHQEHFTLALGLQFLQGKSGDTPWNQLMAAATLIVVPVIALFLFTQRTFVRGIATTGLKG